MTEPMLNGDAAMQVTVQSAANLRKYYRFKVLSLKSFSEDQENLVTELFHFEFGIKAKPQVLQLSEDTYKLMGILDHRVANIYERGEPVAGRI